MRRERDQVRRYDVSQGVLTELSKYRKVLVDLQNEALSSETDLGGWKQRYDDLRKQIVQYMADNISDAESHAFETIGVFQNFQIAEKNYVDIQHIQTVSMVVRDHQWITRMIMDYSRQKQRSHQFLTQESTEDGAR